MKVQKAQDNLQFLAGGGEMGELTRKKNWAETPLGVPQNWPQSLRTTLSILLNSKFPMFLFWGPDLICFYNDAYRPSLGKDGKHPDILGGRGEDYWKEIWKDIKPIIDQVLEKGEASWNEDMLLPIYRNGKMEDVYWTFSYSPVNDESGKPAGVFVTCTETTDKVFAFEQLEESNARFRNTVKQAPVGITILRGKDYIVEMANEAYLQLVDRKESEFINKPIFDSLPEVKESVHHLLDNVMDTGIPYHGNESAIPLIRNGVLGTYYFDFLYHPLKEEDGTISGIIVTVTEVTEKVLSHKISERNEEKLNIVIEASELGMWEWDLKTSEIDYSQRYLEIVGGYKDWNELTHEQLKQHIHPDDMQIRNEALKKALATGYLHYEGRVIWNDKSVHWMEGRGKVFYDEKNQPVKLIGTIRDITKERAYQQEIEENEKQYHNLIYSSPSAIGILHGPDHIIVIGNDAIVEIWGKGKNIIGKPYFTALPELEAQGYKEVFDGVYKTGIPYNAIERPVELLQHGKMELKYYNFLLYPQKNRDGEVMGIGIIATEVTSQALMNKEIMESEKRFRQLADSAPVLIWMSDTDKSSYFFNKGWLNFTGRTMEEENGSGWTQGIHPEDSKRCLSVCAAAFEKRKEFYVEYRLKRHDGNYRWISEKGAPRFTASGEFEGYIGACMDIDNEITNKQLLIENEQKFRLLADSMPQHIWTSDPNGNLNYFNKSVMEYSGLTLDYITKNGWLDIVHPDDREENTKQWMHAIAIGEDFIFEHRFRRHDGEYRWQLSRAIPQKDSQGNIQMWVGTSTDIQEQKTFTRELEKQVTARMKELNSLNESLRKSEERYHLMIEEVQDYAILYLNKEGIVENWNKGAEKIKGYKAEEIIGRSFSDFYTPTDKESNLPHYLLQQAAKYGRYGQEGWRVRKDGTLFWASVVITAVHNTAGELIGFSKVTHDLSSKKEADDKIKMNAAQLEQKNAELERMNKELQSFAYISSHDLQEPLRKIQTFANQIAETEFHNLSETGRNRFGRMQKAAERMQTLINDLLAYSRTNTQDRKFIKTKLSHIIEEVKENMKEELEQNQAAIITVQLSEVSIIPFQFQQLLYNLISNSIKFAREGVSPQITIKSETAKGADLKNSKLNKETVYCHICYSDNGIGFDQQYSEKIFEVFQRLHGKEEYFGTGIGLAIVKKIIDNHNGIITAKGQPEKGAQFDIYIPVG